MSGMIKANSEMTFILLPHDKESTSLTQVKGKLINRLEDETLD